MNKRIPLGEVDLLDFFQRAFLPHKLEATGEPGRQSYVQAITWLHRLVKRPPRVSDVTPANLDKLQRRILQHGFTRTRARTIKVRLSSLAKHAWRLGLLETWQPAPIVKAKGRRRRKSPDGTLQALADKVEPKLRVNVRVAVRWFSRYLGRAAKVEDVCDQTLDSFVSHLAAEGRSANTKRNYRWLLRRLVWGPNLVDEPRPAPEPPPAGSLLAAVEQLPRKRATSCRYAVLRFDRFLNRHSLPADVADADLMKAFRESMLAGGAGESTCQGYRWQLRLLARKLSPEKFPDARQLPPLPSPPPGSVRHFFETVYRPTRLVGADKMTIRGYRRMFRFLCQQQQREVMLNDLDDVLAADFFTWLLEERKLRAVSVNSLRALLFAVWRLAAERGLVDRDPRVRKLRESRDAPDAWSEEETRRIIETPCQMVWRVPTIAGIPKGPYFKALFLVAYWTGLRRKSLFRIRRSDVNLETGWLNAPGDAIKNRRGKQFRLGQDAIDALRHIWEPEREFVFPYPHDSTHLHGQIRKIFRAGKVRPSTRKVCTQLHKMRRTTATMAAIHRGDAAASELLGHSGMEITKRYIDPSKLPGADATEYLPTITTPATSPPAAATTAGGIDAAGDAAAGAGPGRFLEEARQLFAAGYFRAAGMTARVALERHLARLSARRGIKAKSIGEHTMALRRVGVLTGNAPTRMAALMRIANRAAHGKEVSPEQIAQLLQDVEHWLNASQEGGSPMP